MKHFFNKQRMAIVALLSLLTLTGQSCGGPAAGERVGNPKQLTLNYWTVFNDSSSYEGVIAAYKAINPHVIINVKTLRADEYENALLEAFAEDRGPDIFSVPNTAVRKYLPKIEPMPVSTTMEQGIVKGLLQKQQFTVTKTAPSFSNRYMSDTFVDQAYTDIHFDDQTYALPLSMDTLALYYNKDILNAAGIATPAKTYQELQEHVIKLSKQDSRGNILQSGVALGSSANIPRFTDILSLLMMQNGTQMTDDNGFATFDKLPKDLEGRSTLPSADALTFYTDFASPSKQVYTWNASQPNALQAFMTGKLAYFFSYNYNLPIIRAQAPKLNFAVTKAPQIPGNTEVNLANYWVEVVSKKTANKDAAWNFLQFAAKPENVGTFLTASKRLTAVRSLIPNQIEDTDLGPFAEELLTARSWYQGKRPEALDTIFAEMIQSAEGGLIEMDKILKDAAAKVNQTIR